MSSKMNPLRKRNFDILTCGYTVKDKLKEIEDARKLKEKNFEQKKIENNEMMNLMERIFHYMKEYNRDMQRELELSGDVNTHIVKEVLKDDRRERLELERASLERTQEALTDKWGDKEGIVNELRDKHKKRLDKMNKMEMEINFLQKVQNDRYTEHLVSRIGELEIEVERIKSKFETGVYLNERYHAIVQFMEEEDRLLPHKLEIMERSLAQNTKELEDIQALFKDAVESRDYFDNEASEVMKFVEAQNQMREESTQALRAEVAARNVELDKLKKKKPTVLDTLETSLNLDQQTEKIKMEILNYTDLFESIKSGTLVSQAKDIIERMVSSDEILYDQKTKKIELEKLRKELWTKIDELQCDRDRFRFANIEKKNNSERSTKEILQKIAELEQEKIDMERQLKDDGDRLVQLRKGIDTLEGKVGMVKVDLPPAKSKTDRVRLAIVAAKMIHLFNTLKDKGVFHETENLLNCTLFQEKLEEFENQPHFTMIQKSASFTELDLAFKESQAVSREEIKRMSKQIYDAHQKWGGKK